MPLSAKPIILDVNKLSIKDCRSAYWDLAKSYEKVVTGAYCSHCGKFKPKEEFYADPNNASGVTFVCKKCAYDAAVKINSKTGEEVVTRESIIDALKLINKPFIESLYVAAIKESNDRTIATQKKNAWTAMIKNVSSLQQYRGMTFLDSVFDDNTQPTVLIEKEKELDEETVSMFEKNKRYCLANLGYDPFSSASEDDQPLMYSMLAGMLDESTNEDSVKRGACVEIVQCFNQCEKINQVINGLQYDVKNMPKNASTIRSLESTKKDTFNSMLALAKENGITINSSAKTTKGANTWTGIVKEMKEIHLRDAEVNAFDIGTSKGMAQIAELSNKAIINTISLDENDYTEMLAAQKQLIDDLNSKTDAALEEARILKRENRDLKDFLRLKKLIDDEDKVIDD